MRPYRRQSAPWIALGFAATAACGAVPLSSDEGAWLAIARRVADGGALYQDAIDNKSPFVFALVRVLDVLPGPFTLARAVFIGAAAVLLATWCFSVATRVGAPPGRARALGILVGVAAVVQSIFVLTVELVAVVFVVAALRAATSNRFLLAGALSATAPLFDPRAVVLVAGVVLFARALGGHAAGVRAGLVAIGFLTAWFVVVLSIPDLRYALVELNLSSRGASNPWRPAFQVVVAARALFPLAVGFGIVAGIPSRAGGDRVRAAGWWLLVPAVVVAAVSVHSFDHYWTLILPAVPVLGAASRLRDGERRVSAPVLAGAVLLAVTPAFVHTVAHNREQAQLVERYERVARVLRAELLPGEHFAQFTGQPFLGTFLSDRLEMRSPLLGYLVQPSSRRDAALRDLDRRLATATAVVDDGGLSVSAAAVLPPYRPVWNVFRAHLSGFPCARSIDRLTLRFRADHCPEEARDGIRGR